MRDLVLDALVAGYVKASLTLEEFEHRVELHLAQKETHEDGYCIPSYMLEGIVAVDAALKSMYHGPIRD